MASPQGPSPSSLSSFGHSLTALDLSYIVAPNIVAHNIQGEATPVQSRAQQPPSPCPAGHAVPDAPQDTGGPPGCQGPAAQIQLAIDQDPQALFHGAASQYLIPQSVRASRVAPSQVQNPALVSL